MSIRTYSQETHSKFHLPQTIDIPAIIQINSTLPLVQYVRDRPCVKDSYGGAVALRRVVDVSIEANIVYQNGDSI
jgi:hypothetical protein